MLKGIELFWKILTEANNEIVGKKTINFLIKIYTDVSPELEEQISDIRTDFIKRVVQRLQNVEYNESDANKTKKIKRLLLLIEQMLAESELHGTGKVKSHQGLKKGSKITLNIQSTFQVGERKYQISVYENTTLWELKEIMSKKLRQPIELIKLCNINEIKESNNGSTMKELGFKSDGVITCSKRVVDNKSQAKLIYNKQFTPKALEIFIEIFNRFAIDGKMNAQETASFASSCLGILYIYIYIYI